MPRPGPSPGRTAPVANARQPAIRRFPRYASTDDARTGNNTLRHQYRVLSPEEKIIMATVKTSGQQFLDIVATLGNARALDHAKAKIEEAVFWACKHITADPAETAKSTDPTGPSDPCPLSPGS